MKQNDKPPATGDDEQPGRPDPLEEPHPLSEYEEELDEQNDAVIGQALRWSALALLVVAVVAAAGYLLLRPRDEVTPEREIAVEAPQATPTELGDPPPVSFTDVTRDAGIDFVHESGARGERFLPETMGGGVAFFDYDADGDVDLFLLNSDTWEHVYGEGDGDANPTSALYENDGSGTFRDVSREAGLDLRLYGAGVAVGDVDNDGYLDLFVSALGSDRLLHNRPDGERRRFVDVTESAGVAGDDAAWGSSSTFFDADGDGDLDLFVGNYVVWSRQIDLDVNHTLVGIGRAYGPPFQYEGTYPSLFLNRGDGTFEDASASSGVQVDNAATGEPMAKALGVIPVDADGDGATDLLVANDTVRNFFFHNQGDGTFEEVGELYGIAYGRDGTATGAMGIDSAHYREDGALGFAIGNFANEMTSLYVSQGDPTLYADEAIGEGVGAPSRRALSFGLFFFDYDLDGRLDLLQTNGHLEDRIAEVDPSQNYRQSPQLFWNRGGTSGRTFVEVEPESLGALGEPIVGRGSAYADIDGDGDLDVLLLQTGDRAVLLRNDQALGNHWLRLRLIGNGTASNRDAMGAQVELVADGRTQRRQVTATRSYQSQSELTVTFGLGAATQIESLTVTWPDGSEQQVPVDGVDRELTVRQGG